MVSDVGGVVTWPGSEAIQMAGSTVTFRDTPANTYVLGHQVRGLQGSLGPYVRLLRGEIDFE